MPADLKETFTDSIRGRLADPIIGSYVTFFLIYNYDLILIFFSSMDPKSKIEQISHVLNIIKIFEISNILRWLAPLISTLLYLFLWPSISRFLLKRVYEDKAKGEKLKSGIFLLDEITILKDEHSSVKRELEVTMLDLQKEKQEAISLKEKLEHLSIEFENINKELSDNRGRLSTIIAKNKLVVDERDELMKNFYSISNTGKDIELNNILGIPFYRSFWLALKQSNISKLPVLLFLYDPSHPKKSDIEYTLNNMLSYEATRVEIKNNFIPVIDSSRDISLGRYIDNSFFYEKVKLMLIDSKGMLVTAVDSYANKDEGMMIINSLVRAKTNQKL